MKYTASSVVAMYNRTKCLFIETGLVKLFTSMWKISHFIRSDIFQIIPLKSSFQGKIVFWELKQILVSIPTQVPKQNKTKKPTTIASWNSKFYAFFSFAKKHECLKSYWKQATFLKTTYKNQIQHPQQAHGEM